MGEKDKENVNSQVDLSTPVVSDVIEIDQNKSEFVNLDLTKSTIQKGG